MSTCHATLLVVLVSLAQVACSAPDEPERALLFDLTEDEVRDSVAAYAPEGDVERVIEGLVAPFSCEQFASACQRLGPEGAERTLEQVWDDVRSQSDAAEVLANAKLVVRDASTSNAAPTMPSVPQSPQQAVGDTGSICIHPLTTHSLLLGASLVDLGIVVVGGAHYSYTVTSVLVVVANPFPIDAEFEISLSNGQGVLLDFDSLSFAGAGEGDVAVAAFSAARHHELEAAVVSEEPTPCGPLETALELEL